jgi:hypothetical protein
MDVPSFTPERLIVKQNPFIWLRKTSVPKGKEVASEGMSAPFTHADKYLILLLLNANRSGLNPKLGMS